MEINVITYFEQKDGLCGVGFDEIEDINLFDINPPFIEVANEVYDDEIFVLNSHEYGDYVYPVEGVNSWSADNFIHVGVWKIKYKIDNSYPAA